VAHKSAHAFPEFVEDYAVRDEWFRVYIQKGLAIIVESEASKIEFARFYNIDEDKIDVIPLFPGGVVDIRVPIPEQETLLAKFNLTPLSYFFYPAQFWGHKNHYNLILAFKDFLRQSGRRDVRLILTGSDKGNKDYIKSVIHEHGLGDNVNILGFVSNEEMYTLYKNALALTMSTFLGPTNMPVLEAMALGVPVICSDLSGHRESCRDGVLYAHPTDRSQWTAAMHAVLDQGHRDQLLAKAAAVNATSGFNIENAVRQLERILLKYVYIRGAFR
jgi:glycosyltransferase involved in cell wall biosynthesis